MALEEVGTRSNKKAHRSATAAPSSPISEDEHIEPAPFSLASLGLQRVGTVPPPKPQPQQPIQMLNARGMPARIRKRNRLFFDDDIINDDKPLRMSLSPKKTPVKPSINSATSTSTTATAPPTSSSPNRTPTKILKKRKVASRYMRGSIGGDESKRRTLTSSSNTAPSTPTKSSNTAHSTPNTTPKSSTRGGGNHRLAMTPGGSSTSSLSSSMPVDKLVGQSIGMRLRNLLKLPKAHKWVIYEWFYSFIDKPLFDGENDFQVVLADTLPRLRTRLLTRAEWRKVRSLLGKPRRCSQAFFDEERRELERKRQKIRFMQTRKSGDIKDLNFVRDLPDKIPLPLPVGTKVTARLRSPQDGIFSGTVDAFDSVISTYRVTFDRNGLGTHSVPDYEIVSENFHEMLPLQSITRDFRPNLMASYNNNANNASSPTRGGVMGVRSALNMNLNKSGDPLLGQEVVIESPFRNPIMGRDNLNGYSIKLLETLVRLKRTLAIKRSKLQRLSDMNNDAEMKMSQQITANASSNNNNSLSSDESQSSQYGGGGGGGGGGASESQSGGIGGSAAALSEEFQRRYASIVISMEKMNRDMQDYLNEVQKLSNELSRDPQVQAMLAPSYLREKCRESAEEAVQRNNQGVIKNDGVLSLIKNLSTILLVASHLGNDNVQVSKVLEGCIEEVRSNLYSANVETFQKNVTIHLHHIRLGIGQCMLTPNGSSVSINAVNGMLSSSQQVEVE